LCEAIEQRKRELLLARVDSVHNQIEECKKQTADGTLAEDEIDDMSEQDSDIQTTEGSSSQDQSDFTSEYDSDASMITHGRSSEDEYDFFISEYDDDSQEQVANGTMVDYVMDKLFHFVCCGYIKSTTQQCIQYC